VNEPKSIAEMAADALREMAILLFVFAPLEFALNEKPVLTSSDVGAIVGLGAMLFGLGLILERKRL